MQLFHNFLFASINAKIYDDKYKVVESIKSVWESFPVFTHAHAHTLMFDFHTNTESLRKQEPRNVNILNNNKFMSSVISIFVLYLATIIQYFVAI